MEMILVMPWLMQVNRDVDRREKRVQVQQRRFYIDLPTILPQNMEPKIDEVNLCRAT